MKRICVYCGSSPGNAPEYAEGAKELAKLLAEQDIALVYGGASIGIMGEIADAVLAAGGEVIGVMPKALADKEIAHKGLSELIIVESMHERKSIMAELADGFIALPGGLGTLDELFEMLTWAQLGFHQKPCGALNINAYYQKLVEFLQHTAEEGFVKPQHQELLLVEEQPKALLQSMQNYKPRAIDKLL